MTRSTYVPWRSTKWRRRLSLTSPKSCSTPAAVARPGRDRHTRPASDPEESPIVAPGLSGPPVPGCRGAARSIRRRLGWEPKAAASPGSRGWTMTSRHARRHPNGHSIAIAVAPAGGASAAHRTAPPRRGLSRSPKRNASVCDCGRLVATTQTKSRPPRRGLAYVNSLEPHPKAQPPGWHDLPPKVQSCGAPEPDLGDLR